MLAQHLIFFSEPVIELPGKPIEDVTQLDILEALQRIENVTLMNRKLCQLRRFLRWYEQSVKPDIPVRLVL